MMEELSSLLRHVNLHAILTCTHGNVFLLCCFVQGADQPSKTPQAPLEHPRRLRVVSRREADQASRTPQAPLEHPRRLRLDSNAGTHLGLRMFRNDMPPPVPCFALFVRPRKVYKWSGVPRLAPGASGGESSEYRSQCSKYFDF